jgi:hypothetical protein
MTAPCPGFRSSVELSSPGATYSAKFFTALTFSVIKYSLARGIIELFPGTPTFRDEVGNRQAGDNAMGYALPGITGRDIHFLVARVTANETAVVDRVHDLARPPVRLPPKVGDKATYPRLDPLETDPGIVGFAGLVVGAANDKVIGRAGTWLQSNIVVGVERVPIKGVEHGPARYRVSHRVSAIWSLLGMECHTVIDRGVGRNDRCTGADRAAFRGADSDCLSILFDGFYNGVSVKPPLAA